MAKVEVLSGEIVEEERPDEEIEEGLSAEVEQQEEEEAPALVVQIGDEPPEVIDDEFFDETGKKKPLPPWVVDMRREYRERDKKIKELERKLGEREPAGEQPAKLGAKPTRADCDFDDDEYDRRLEKWYEDKRAVDAAETEREQQAKTQQDAWQSKLSRYGEAKQTLGANDYEDAETLVTDTLSVTQQGIIVQGAENAALVTYALGKNPTRAKELAKITDPIEFAFAVAKLEAQLKVTNRNSAPPPEKVTRAATGGSMGGDATLEKLRSDAAKTGDYSKVAAYKREKKAK